MKQKIYLSILLFIFILFTFCNKSANKNDIEQNKTEVSKKVPEKKVNKVILEINENKYYETDFKTFLDLNSRSFSELKNRDTIYSYILKKYIIQKILLYKANIDKFDFDNNKLLSGIKSNLNFPEKDRKELLDIEKTKIYLNETLYTKIAVKEKEIRKYYMSNKDKYRRKAEAHLYEIMVKDKNKANEIRAILNTEPHKFSEIAKKESESKMAKEDGSHGFIEIDSFPETFRKFIKSVSLNKVTPVVELLYGEINGKKVYTYHIFKVTKRKRERLLFQSKVRDSIEKELIQHKKEQIYQEFLKDLSNSFKITIRTKNLFFKYKKI